jgi:AraC family transcriptional regulator
MPPISSNRRRPYASYLIEHRLLGTNDVRLIHADQPAGEFPDPALPEYFLYVALRGASELSFDWGCGRWTGLWQAGDVSIAPPHAATAIHVSEPHAFLALALPARFVGSAMEEIAGAFRTDLGVAHARTFASPLIVGLLQRFWRGATHGGMTALAEDCALVGIIEALARPTVMEAAPTHGLHDRRFGVVSDRIEDDPGRQLRLAELAEEVGLSPMHFARQFRRRTGHSPHQYLMTRRIARLRGLLATTSHPLTDLSDELGFASQAHMTNAFTKTMGVSPGRYRRKIGA